MKRHNIIFVACFLMISLIPWWSCNKLDYSGKNPYAGAKPPLTIRLNTSVISPAVGKVGTTVTLKGENFLKYRDSGLEVDFNGIPAKIKQTKDSSISVEVPEMASSGMVTLSVAQQIFPGPVFQVLGSIKIDPKFRSLPGANGTINCIQFVPGGKYMIGGSFSDYGNAGLQYGYHGVARINADGMVDKTFQIGKGITGVVNTIAVQPNGKYILGGSFDNYNDRFKAGAISNIMRLNSDGSIDSMIVNNQSGNKDTLPSLNAYFDGSVTKIFQHSYTPSNTELIVVGTFKYYMQKDFSISTADSKLDSVAVDSIRMESLARLNEDGSIDSTFNYDTIAHRSFPGPNGPVYDALMQDDGKLIIVGNFTSYHGKKINRIARLDKDGSLDPTFNIGDGPDDRVYAVTRLQDGKYLIGGQFNKVDGIERRKVAILNPDGVLDQDFNVGTGSTAGPDGIVSEVEELKNGKILVSGSFDRFSGFKRDGTVILNEDGTISKTFNNLGAMTPVGGINQALNVPTQNATILVGSFTKFDTEPVNRILQLIY